MGFFSKIKRAIGKGARSLRRNAGKLARGARKKVRTAGKTLGRISKKVLPVVAPIAAGALVPGGALLKVGGFLESTAGALLKKTGLDGDVWKDVFSTVLRKENARVAELFRKVKNTYKDVSADGEFTFDDIGRIIRDVYRDKTNAALDNLDDWQIDVKSNLLGFMEPAKETAEEKGNFITRTIQGAIDQVTGFVGESVDKVTNGVKSVVEQVGTAASGFVSRTVTAVRDTVGRAVAALRAAFERVADIIRGVFISVGEFMANTLAGIRQGIVATVRSIGAALKTTFNKVVGSVRAIISRVVDLGAQIIEGFKRVVRALVQTAGAAVERVAEKLANLPEALKAAGILVADKLGEINGQIFGSIPEKIWETLRDMLGQSLADDEAAKRKLTQTALFGERVIARTRSEARELFADFMPRNPTARWLVNIVVGLIAMGQLTAGIASAQADLLLQEYNQEFPTRILQPLDAVRATWYDALPRDDALRIIGRSGFTEADAERLFTITERAADENNVLSWWLRGFVTDEQATAMLKRSGWNDLSIELLKRNARFIPPPQDLITMAVREAFSPETAERFGQFEDFPDEFATWADKQGISDEWARRYWAAHWALPSVQQGYEMLHRGVISEDDLRLLLKAADVMPFWRDKLIAISFAPLTRVDIRRMHKLGVLSLDEVKRAYLDLGYDETNAARLTEFTRQLNAPPVAEDDTELDQLSRSSILNFYADGVIGKDRARLLLGALGVSQDAIELYLDNIDLEQDRRERKNSTALILEKAKAGLISFEDAQDALARLGLETVEQQRALTKLIRDREHRIKLPSKGDLDRMFKAGLIESGEYLETLGLLGYSDKWAKRYLTLLGG